MQTVCPNCGTARAEQDFCFCPVGEVTAHDPGPEAAYSPPWGWHIFGFSVWMLTVGAAIGPSHSSAYLFGEGCGALIIAVLLRVVYVTVFARGPQLWGRALLSPWVWAIGIVVNVLTAGGHHPH
jgi:hypothetical protein